MSLLLLLGGSDTSGTPAVSEFDVREAVHALLLGDTGITDLIGGRLYPDAFPQSMTTYPSVMYDVVENVQGQWLSGPSDTSEARFIFEVRSRTKSECVDVKKAIADAIDGYTGLGTDDLFYFLWIGQANEDDVQDRPSDGTDQRVYGTSVEYRVKHRVTIN